MAGVLHRLIDPFQITPPLKLTHIIPPPTYPPHNTTAPLPILARESPWRHPLGRRRQLQWTVVTDKSVGGRSEASFDVRVPLPPSPPSPSEAGAAAAGGAGEGDGGGMMEGRDDGDTPLAVFSGELSTMRPSADPTCVAWCLASVHPSTYPSIHPSTHIPASSHTPPPQYHHLPTPAA